VAVQLQTAGAAGERALLLYPPGLRFLEAFFGCMYAGTVPVPAYPPTEGPALARLQTIAADARPLVACTTAELRSRLERAAGDRGLRWLATDELDRGAAGAWRDPGAEGETLALLQYTSGSTATPRGVMVSHAHLLANQRAIQTAFGHDQRTVFCGWLPLFHDMGLIGNVLHPLWLGIPCVLMSPLAFLKRPLRWLRAIERHQATTSGGPNFAYDLCVAKTTAEERAALDLSGWQVAFNGSEPVRAGTMERFAAAFRPAGFRPEAFYTCYGLAEATLFVAGGRPGTGPVVRGFRAAELERDRAVPAEGDGARRLAGCGRAQAGHELAVVDPATGKFRPDRAVGEVWVAGPSVAGGYWGRPQESEATFRASTADGAWPWLRTGDLGFLDGGELFVTGRRKDLVIVRGRNHYPQDIEETVERSHPALRPGCSAAFAVDDPEGDAERLVVAAEIRRDRAGDLDAVAAAVRQAVSEEHELAVDAVVLLEQGAVPKTSSGKVQRHAARAGFQAGRLPAVHTWRTASTPAAAGQAASGDGQAAGGGADVAAWLLSRLAELVGVAPDELDPRVPITRYGLDSMRAAQLQVPVEQASGVELSLPALLEGPSARELARAVLDGRRRVAGRAPAPLAASGSAAAGPQPLSRNQEALWFMQQLAPDSAIS